MFCSWPLNMCVGKNGLNSFCLNKNNICIVGNHNYLYDKGKSTEEKRLEGDTLNVNSNFLEY